MWFDGQAEAFEDTAGLEPAIGRRVAEAIVELSGAGGDELIVDVGAGTGSIGRHFAALPNRYVALERSRPMLAIFQHNPLSRKMVLAEADCDRPWPIAACSVAVVFASRVVHHLKPRHFIDETRRVCRPGGTVLLGRITRDPDSLPSRLQRQKRALLAEQGMSIGGGEQAVRKVMDDCRAMGATALQPATVARWTRSVTPRQLLENWEGKPQLTSSAAAVGMSAEQRAATVEALRNWARGEFGDLDRVHELTEEYVLQGVTWNQIS